MTTVANVHAANTYTDFGGLAAMKKMAKEDYERGIEEAAKQVEAVFLQMLTKSMHSASQVLKSDLFDSNESETYQELYASQLGISLSETGSLGIAKMISQQLKLTNQSKPSSMMQAEENQHG